MRRKDVFRAHRPIMIHPGLAVDIGLNKAIVLCHINYHCALNEALGRDYADGYFWVRKSYRQWSAKDFPWWSEATVKKLFLQLEKDNLIISTIRSDDPFDRTKSYRVSEHALSKFDYAFDLMESNWPTLREQRKPMSAQDILDSLAAAEESVKAE